MSKGRIGGIAAAVLIVLAVIRSVQIVHSKPIKRCMKYFGV